MPFTPSLLHPLPPSIPLVATITFPSPGSGLPLLCTRPLSIRFVDLCDVEWRAQGEGQWLEGAGQGQVLLHADADALRLCLRVPALLGLVGSCCWVRCCGQHVCNLRVLRVAQGGEGGVGGEGVEVEVVGGEGAHAWVIEAVAAACV